MLPLCCLVRCCTAALCCSTSTRRIVHAMSCIRFDRSVWNDGRSCTIIICSAAHHFSHFASRMAPHQSIMSTLGLETTYRNDEDRLLMASWHPVEYPQIPLLYLFFCPWEAASAWVLEALALCSLLFALGHNARCTMPQFVISKFRIQS